jgi:hypothetical protein
MKVVAQIAYAAATAASLAAVSIPSRAAAEPAKTIVLVHGAFADGPSWGESHTEIGRSGP